MLIFLLFVIAALSIFDANDMSYYLNRFKYGDSLNYEHGSISIGKDFYIVQSDKPEALILRSRRADYNQVLVVLSDAKATNSIRNGESLTAHHEYNQCILALFEKGQQQYAIFIEKDLKLNLFLSDFQSQPKLFLEYLCERITS